MPSVAAFLLLHVVEVVLQPGWCAWAWRAGVVAPAGRWAGRLRQTMPTSG